MSVSWDSTSNTADAFYKLIAVQCSAQFVLNSVLYTNFSEARMPHSPEVKLQLSIWLWNYSENTEYFGNPTKHTWCGPRSVGKPIWMLELPWIEQMWIHVRPVRSTYIYECSTTSSIPKWVRAMLSGVRHEKCDSLFLLTFSNGAIHLGEYF